MIIYWLLITDRCNSAGFDALVCVPGCVLSFAASILLLPFSPHVEAQSVLGLLHLL